MLKFLTIACLLFILGLSLLITNISTWIQYYSPRHSGHYSEFFPQTPRSGHPLPSPDPPRTMHLPKLVWWTDSFTPHTGREVVQCFAGNCRVGGYRETESADALMFYGTEFSPYDLPLPRNPDLLWTLFHEESPLNSYHLCTPEIIRLFNFTCTSSRYSDLPLSTMHLSHISQLSYLSPKKTTHKNLLQRQDALSPVVYVQSHCSVPSFRDRLVTELMKHIQVDSYGQCLHNKDLPPSLSRPVDSMFSPEFYQILSNYKFILTFENAIGYDYISEKIFRAFELGVVPVYYGSGTVSDWSPAPHSVIEVRNFESMQLLAEYLHMLNYNDTAYDEYLRYKEPGGIVNQLLLHSVKHQPFTSMYYYELASKYGAMEHLDSRPNAINVFQCEVCDLVHKQRKLREEGKVVFPKFANFSHFVCPTPHLGFGLEMKDSFLFDEYDWYSNYWQSFIESNTISTMTNMNISQPSIEWYQERVLKGWKSLFPSILH